MDTAQAYKASGSTFIGCESHNKAKQMGDVHANVPCKKCGIVESIRNLTLQQVVDLIMDRDGIRL